MIIGVHALIYSKEPEQVRAFLKDVLEFKPIDIGHGWLIFALPPAELAVHPGEGPGRHELYLMCDDVKALIKKLESKGYETREVQDVGWGLRTAVTLPGGDELGIYEPRHASPIKLKKPRAAAKTSKKKSARTKPARAR